MQHGLPGVTNMWPHGDGDSAYYDALGWESLSGSWVWGVGVRRVVRSVQKILSSIWLYVYFAVSW